MTAASASRSGKAFAFAGVSGSGKTTVCRMLEKRGLGRISVSHTTRRRSEQEEDGRDYHFVDRKGFEAMLANGEMLESAVVHGQLYGTSRSWLERTLAGGENVLLEIDVQGCSQARERLGKVCSIFLLPPDFETLERRLTERRRESRQEIGGRLRHGLHELTHMDEFDYILVNHDLQDTADNAAAVIRAQLSEADAPAARRFRREEQAGVVSSWRRMAADRLESLNGKDDR